MLKDIKENVVLEIMGERCKPISKVCYYTETEVESYYFKIRLDNNKTLVISEDFTTVMYGEEVYIEDKIAFPSPEEIIYDSQKLSLVASDYQFVRYIEFGKFGEYEAEVKFMDYANEDESKILSLGVDVFRNARDDVYLNVITISDIKIMN